MVRVLEIISIDEVYVQKSFQFTPESGRRLRTSTEAPCYRRFG